MESVMGALNAVVDYGVIGLLLELGFMACGVAVERWRYFHRVNPAGFQHREALEIALTKH